MPYVIEPAMGVDRALLTVLIDAYEEQRWTARSASVLHLRPALAPIKVAVMPLLRNRPELVELGQRLAADLKQRCRRPMTTPPASASCYRRQDEIGTPFCVTVDVESLDDGAATIRERDSMTQERVATRRPPERIADARAGAAWRASDPSDQPPAE